MQDYENMALLYAEKYGIYCGYKVQGNKMIYYTSWRGEHTTYKAVVNLDTGRETRTAMAKYYKPYAHIGACQVNDCV